MLRVSAALWDSEKSLKNSHGASPEPTTGATKLRGLGGCRPKESQYAEGAVALGKGVGEFVIRNTLGLPPVGSDLGQITWSLSVSLP